MKSQDELRQEIERLQAQVEPLQQKIWGLEEQYDKAKRLDFIDSGLLSRLKWRVCIHDNYANVFLRLSYDGRLVPELQKVVPYPHSHWEIADGVTLSQDDGDITISFDRPGQVAYYIKKWQLIIIDWGQLIDLLKRTRRYELLLKQLEAKHGKEGHSSTG